MKYCKDTTEQHAVCTQCPDGLEPLSQIFNAEGYRGVVLFDKEVGVNLDKVEIKRCTGVAGRKATMDFAVGLSREGKKCQMLLVELKINVKNPANVAKSEIEDKIKHSTEILSHEPPISDSKIIIFQDKQKAEARSHIARLYGKPPKPKVLVKTAGEFKDEYFID